MVYLFLAEGFEECEALIPLDILRRANIEVKTIGVTGKTVCGSHNIPVVCDEEIENIEFSSDISAVILPGGMPGTLNLKANKKLENIILEANNNGLIVAAICAAPLILGNLGLLKGKSAICYPGFENELIGAQISEKCVAKDGNIITAKGVGAAFDFGFEILNALTNTPEKTEELKKTMIYGG
jgi:4-methyl-5(b-hydroxyethyl)-thiazole monophosphate biosynthesis